jgi:hypothetical protein
MCLSVIREKNTPVLVYNSKQSNLMVVPTSWALSHSEQSEGGQTIGSPRRRCNNLRLDLVPASFFVVCSLAFVVLFVQQNWPQHESSARQELEFAIFMYFYCDADLRVEL